MPRQGPRKRSRGGREVGSEQADLRDMVQTCMVSGEWFAGLHVEFLRMTVVSGVTGLVGAGRSGRICRVRSEETHKTFSRH